MSHYSFFGFFSYLMTYKKPLTRETLRVTLGNFDPVIISDRPNLTEMEALCARQAMQSNRIRLLKDRNFFGWRFNNPIKRYIFYYFRKNNRITGYVVIGLSPNFRRGYILDFAGVNGEPVEFLIKYMIQDRHFDILSIYDFCLDHGLRKTLKALGFKTSGLVRRLEQKMTGELPVLIRPVRKGCTKDDWLIEGLDIRKIENWQITEICSDAV